VSVVTPFQILLLVLYKYHSPWGPSGSTMALGSAQLLTDMSTGGISWGVKAAGV